MVSPEKARTLLETLIDATRSGRASWKEGGQQTYSTTAKEGTIYIIDETMQEKGCFFLNIFNNKQQVVESIEISTESSDYQAAEKLFEGARRSALKSDEIIDKLILEFSGNTKPTR